ncbi:hypothetical protein Tco_0840990 [Tanacetum coccineum]|uniref:Reverse transcriptase domain-containing protein n=1 Tax=Tanacetum coccineum TaxID=301880 RepID=A0ABQ5AZ02_9ASTR
MPRELKKKRTGGYLFALIILIKEARRLLTHGCHAGNPCALQSNLTAQSNDPMIGGNGRLRWRGASKAHSVHQGRIDHQGHKQFGFDSLPNASVDRFDESFYEAWDRFNDLLRACPHHGFSKLHQLDTFYNVLNANDQDSLNSAAGGNFLDKMPRECLRIIESKSKVRNSRNKAVVAKVSSNSSTPGISPDVAALTTEVSELKNLMKTMLINKQKAQAPTPVKAVEQSCVTCGGGHSYKNYPATDGNNY